LNIGTNAVARTITMGNGTGATSLVLNCGTGALNIGTNAVARTITMGNSEGATGIVLNSGSSGNILMSGIPTADPSVQGKLYTQVHAEYSSAIFTGAVLCISL